MTDMITVSRKEIDKLLTQLNITHQDIRALLDKAEVSEPVALMAIKIAQLEDRVKVLEDLLSSAYNIANRNGKDTHWPRFAGQLHIHGINPITPKTFKILPSDDEYTSPPDQSAKIAELEAEVEKLKIDARPYDYCIKVNISLIE